MGKNWPISVQPNSQWKFPETKSLRGCLSTLALLILTLSRMTLSNVSFSDILRNVYLDHFDTFGENFDFDTFKNDTFESL